MKARGPPLTIKRRVAFTQCSGRKIHYYKYSQATIKRTVELGDIMTTYDARNVCLNETETVLLLEIGF